jgi:hypothetical protein
METNNKLLIDIANKLNDSTKKTWDAGDVSQWAKFGRQMWNTIDAVTPMIRTLAGANTTEQPKASKKEQKVVMTDKQFVINELIDKGWLVISVTPPSPNSGEFCFLLER